MKQIMPTATIPPSPQPAPTADIQLPTLKAKSRRGTKTDAADKYIRPTEEIIYETPKHEPVRQDDDDDYEDEFLEEDAKDVW